MPWLECTWPVLAQASTEGGPRLAMQMMPWFAWVAIVAIVGGSLSSIITAWIKHRERMAMIQMGMHPDLPPQPGPAGKPYAREAAEI